MRLIDADALKEQLTEHLKCCNAGSIVEACFMTAIDHIEHAPTISAPPPNDPLTLEDLREMDGELVWVVQPHETLPPFWGIVDADDELVTGSKYCADFEGYDTEWKAYRSKQE